MSLNRLATGSEVRRVENDKAGNGKLQGQQRSKQIGNLQQWQNATSLPLCTKEKGSGLRTLL